MTARRSDGNNGGKKQSVVVYWRPGCVFCVLLRRQLRNAGVPTEERNIREDPKSAAFVRRHANGNETVPTVDVAGNVMVNPSVKQVVAAARQAGVDIGEAKGAGGRGGGGRR
ncbi:MAG: glutaredoxin domain-containing protein [Aquihabitans sp.]